MGNLLADRVLPSHTLGVHLSSVRALSCGLLGAGMAEIQRADRRSRTFAILALLIVLVGGIVFLAQFESWLIELRGMPDEAAKGALTVVFGWSVGIGTVAVALAGCHVWWWGKRVRCAMRFPPPDATLVRDMVVLKGQAAVSRGNLLQIVGSILIVCAAALAILSWWLLNLLRNVPS